MTEFDPELVVDAVLASLLTSLPNNHKDWLAEIVLVAKRLNIPSYIVLDTTEEAKTNDPDEIEWLLTELKKHEHEKNYKLRPSARIAFFNKLRQSTSYHHQ